MYSYNQSNEIAYLMRCISIFSLTISLYHAGRGSFVKSLEFQWVLIVHHFSLTCFSIIMNLIWTEKYRPETLKQVKSQDQILTILKQIIKTGEVENNILFYGLPGKGKTSIESVRSRRNTMIAFHDFLRERIEGGGFSTEDVLADFAQAVQARRS